MSVPSQLTKRQKNELTLLCLIREAGGVRSRIRLQKLVCLAEYRNDQPAVFSFAFRSHFYGPYSEDLRRTTDNLVAQGLLSEELTPLGSQPIGDSSYSYHYSVTAAGEKLLTSKEGRIRAESEGVHALLKEYGHKRTEEIVRAAKEASGMESLRAGG